MYINPRQKHPVGIKTTDLGKQTQIQFQLLILANCLQ